MADDDGDISGPWDSLEGSSGGQCLNRLVESLQDLDLPEIGDNVWIRDPPVLDNGSGIVIPIPSIIACPIGTFHSSEDGPAGGADFRVRTMLGYYYRASGADPRRGRSQSASLAARLYVEHALHLNYSKRADTYGTDWVPVDGYSMIATTIEPGDIRQLTAWQLLTLDVGWLTVSH